MSAKRRSQIAWALNAWGNHAFSTTILVGFFPIFFDKYWAKELPGATSTFWLGLTNSAAALVVMVLAPWLGALADLRARKKRYLGIFTVLGVAASAALAGIGAGQWQWALLVFALLLALPSTRSHAQTAAAGSTTAPSTSEAWRRPGHPRRQAGRANGHAELSE